MFRKAGHLGELRVKGPLNRRQFGLSAAVTLAHVQCRENPGGWESEAHDASRKSSIKRIKAATESSRRQTARE